MKLKCTEADYARIRKQAVMLFQSGMARTQIATTLAVSLGVVNDELEARGLWLPHEKSGPRNPWLPADDESNTANSRGYWVPTPDEIEHMKVQIRYGLIDIASAHGSEGRQRREAMNRA